MPRAAYSAYSASTAASDVRANAALSYSIDKNTSVTAALSVSSLLADAKDSPLTRKRSAEMAVVAVNYAFRPGPKLEVLRPQAWQLKASR